MKRAWIILVFLPALIFAQDIEREKAEHQRKLQELRDEIAEVERKIEKAGREEAALNDLIADLDYKLTLRKRLLKELESDRRLTELELTQIKWSIKNLRGEILRAEGTIDSLRKDIAGLRSLVAKRAVYAYKHWHWDELRLIFTAEDFNQAMSRKKYFNIIAQRDRLNMDALREKKEQLNGSLLRKRSLEASLMSDQSEMKDRLQYKSDLIEEAKYEEQKLFSERGQKAKWMKRIINNKAALRKELEIKKSAADQVEKMITALEKRALAGMEVSERFPDLDFPKLRGIMNWPARGKVIAHFGSQLNRDLNTWTENTGIDIKAEAGSPVRAVASGKVTIVTWLRGYGSTMIISHPDGFYTVYTHLDEILVNPQSYVTGGSVIATVGDSGSLGGSKLHFEIWEKREKQDPEKWLNLKNSPQRHRGHRDTQR